MFFSSLNSFGEEVNEVCAKYKNTNKEYKVQAHILSGTELNQKTKGYSYNSYSKYAVIFWGKDEASIIELDYPGTINSFGTDGKDQKGYKWEISKSSAFCNN